MSRAKRRARTQSHKAHKRNGLVRKNWYVRGRHVRGWFRRATLEVTVPLGRN